MSKERIFIDVREPFEFATGHAKGAINISPTELMSNSSKLQEIDKDSEIIVYCRSGSRSNVAIQLLQQMGYTNLTNGINAEHVTKNYLS